MLPRPPACRGAVQRHLPTTIESIWVSDDILRHAWQRFVGGCRTDRRFGSFVPGPLESRRRMGKRRMAHLSEALPPPLHSIASLWSSFWEADRSQWQWQAPRNRKTREHDTTDAEGLNRWWEEHHRLVEGVPKIRVAVKPDIHKDIHSFREHIKSSQLEELSTICNDFNKLFTHSLSLGLLSEIAIAGALGGICNDLHATCPDAAAEHCLSFYTATWEGLVSCRVLPIEQMECTVPTVLLKLLARLPMTSDVGVLAIGIISRLSTSQLAESTRAICSIVVRLVKGWLQDCFLDDHSNSLPIRNIYKRNFVQSRRHSSRQPKLFKLTLEQQRSRARWRVKRARKQAKEVRAADALVPFEICKILQHLPQNILEIVVRHGSQSVAEFYKSHPVLPADIRYSWLLVVSQLSTTKPVFLDAWKTLEALGTLRNQVLMPVIVLRYLTSQGWMSDVDSLEEKLRSFAHERGVIGFAAMASLLDEARQEQLLGVLLSVGKFFTIYHVLSQLKTQGVRLPVKTSVQIVNAVSKHDHVLALRIFQECLAISPDLCPNLVISLIRDPRIHPHRIWAILDTPIYGELPRRCRTRLMGTNRHRMAPKMISLIREMAVAFAHCRDRSPSVILRNVTQCLQHLRRHHAPPSPRVSRAVAHATINLRIESDKLVPEARAEWALRIIQSAEGPKVAETVTMIVDVWNEHKKRSHGENS